MAKFGARRTGVFCFFLSRSKKENLGRERKVTKQSLLVTSIVFSPSAPEGDERSEKAKRSPSPSSLPDRRFARPPLLQSVVDVSRL